MTSFLLAGAAALAFTAPAVAQIVVAPLPSLQADPRFQAEAGYAAARELYEWSLPLLRMDTVPKFVQLIKLMQERVGLGSERVRAPRLVVEGAEREQALAVIDHAIAIRTR